MSIYAFKPRFQALLRPFVRVLAGAGVTANQVTLLACLLSVALGLVLTLWADHTRLFLLLPAWMLVRMALNAIDGMLAREFAQQSALGAFLNELTDVISDAFLYLPFAYLGHFQALWVAAVIALAGLVEMTGCVALMVGASRRYDGPFGKSDRAAAFGALALAVGLGLPPAGWLRVLFPFMAFLCCVTIIQRVRRGLQEAAAGHRA